MMKSISGLTATEYALVLGVVSLTLVAGFETFVSAFDDPTTGIFPALVAKLSGIAANI